MASSIVLSDNGVTSGSAGIKSTGGNDGVLLLQTTTASGTATTAVLIDNAQNVGVGVTPSAWNSIFKSLDVGATASFVGSSGGANVFNNAYYNGTDYIYKTTAAATRYLQSSGAHQWFNAPSGTAGNAITFTQAMTLDASGNLLVGTTGTPSGYFPAKFISSSTGSGQNAINSYIDDNGGAGINSWVATASGTRTHINFYDGAPGSRALRGSITSNGSVMTYGGTSDYRLKEGVQPMVGALEKVAALKPCTYTWKESGVAGQGFIAHELQAVVPDAVVGEKDAVNEDGSIKAQQIDTSFLVATLTAAIKEQQALIVSMREELDTLKAKVGA